MKISEANLRAKYEILNKLDDLFDQWAELDAESFDTWKITNESNMSQEEIDMIRKQIGKRIRSVYHLLGFTTGIGE